MRSQNLSGNLYDGEAAVSGARIMNVTSKSMASSDESGHFIIFAKINDTLIFSSLFHRTKQLVIIPSHLKTTQVFELRKSVNELDEVQLHGSSPRNKNFEKTETRRVNKQFKTDVERNPHLYRRPNANSGPIDILEIGRRVVKLFKRKTPRENIEPIPFITSEDLDILFKSDKFFNDTFLLLELNITKDNKYLFFAYCETKDLSSELLNPSNHIYFIDKLLVYSEEFQKILKESQKADHKS